MSGGGPIRVLLVLDSPVQRELARQIFSLCGDLELAVASDGLEGLALARSFCPQVILLDAVLPLLSGLELLRRYRREGGQARALVAVLSGRPALRAAAFAAGADLVLLFPAQWGEILRYIRFFGVDPASSCRGLLEEMGAPPRWAGTGQAAFCAGVLSQDRSPLLKGAYAEAAAQYRTDAACIEVNIRRVIRQVHRQNTAAYRSLGLPAGDKPPSNKDFLLALVQAAKIPL